MGARALLTATAIVGLLTLLITQTTAFNRYTIGGRQGWNPGVNYTLWNNQTRYYVGDWLVFLYQPGQADVIQVNKTNYDLCNADNPITNYSKGRSYAFRLNHTGDFFFICSRGYCYNGMKIHIKAEKVPPPPPPGVSHLSGVGNLRHNTLWVLSVVSAAIVGIL